MLEKVGSNLPQEAPVANTEAAADVTMPKGKTVDGTQTAAALQFFAGVAQTSENELVAFEDGIDDISLASGGVDNTKLLSIQREYNSEFENYLQYQREMVELQKEKSDYERQIELHKDNPETVRKYQAKLDGVNSQISTLESETAQCERNIQSLMTEYNTELANMAAASYTTVSSSAAVSTAASSGGVQPAAGGNALRASNVVYSAGSGTSSGNISQNLANALDRRLGNGFSAKCQKVAGYLGCNVNDLLAMMYSESGLQTTARNKSSNAIGLIQFMPSTLKANGYTTEQVASMSALQQLDVVADIFMKAKRMAGYGANERIDGGTLYAINWLPAYAKRDTLATRGGKYYSSGLDMDKSGSVTKADLQQRLQKKYNEMLHNI